MMRLGAVLALLSAVFAEAVSVTPVEKVVQLLGSLVKKLEQEGQNEATAYDKYSCFCKEQADNKLYAIETSTAKIEGLTSTIEKLSGEISLLDADIGQLNQDILALEGEMSFATMTREMEHETFVGESAEVEKAIDAVERAIQAMKDSKKALVGRAELEASALSQVRTAAKVALSSRTISGLDVHRLSLLANDPYTYKYKSNDIIATLQTLGQTFSNRKSQLEGDEFNRRTAHELQHQGRANEKKFMEKEKREKEEVREAKAAEKANAEGDKQQETDEKEADQKFLTVMQVDCEDKASLWDQRSRTRAQELQAIATAMDALKTGVAPNYKANKKLVGLQRRSTVKGHWVFVTETGKAPASFLQMHGVSLRGSAKVDAQRADKVHQLLVSSAAKLQSPLLSVAALKVRAAGDHFVKVRQIIKDLVAQLESQATAEQTSKQFCDTQTKAAIDNRDAEQANVERIQTQISAKNAEKDQLRREVAELTKGIAQNAKALAEATELRQEEQTENDATIRDAGIGKEQVELALNVLKQFYEQQSTLLQTVSEDPMGHTPWVATDSDRQGLTVKDRSPEIFDAEYKGSQEASKGIMGLLEVILADFGRTGAAVSANEQDAVDKFSTFETTNTDDTSTKQGSVDAKNGYITVLDDELVTDTDALTTAQAAHTAALGELDRLHSMCVAGAVTYKERVAKREKEIEALKEAHNILENWQK